jgi:hypothetical protein
MRWCGWLVLAACSSDPSLAIAVHHPAAYAVAQTVVTVYAGGDISCNEVALGDRTEAELAAITVDEVDVSDGGRVEVSRLGGKSVTARGYDADHRFVTAGCKDLGEIAGATQVKIETQPTAVVAIDPGQPDRPLGERTILVNVTDVNGNAMDGTVSWQLTGPAGAPDQPPAAGLATRNGDAKIHVEDLGTPGPEGLRIRVPWVTAPPPLVTGFDLSHAITLALGGGAAPSHPSCAVRGHAGKPATLVCLTQGNALGHRDAVEIAWQTDHYATRAIAIPASMDNQFAVLVDRDGSADEPVYVVSANGQGNGSWYRLEAAAGSPIVFDDAPQGVTYVPKCRDNATTALVGVQTGVGQAAHRRFYTPAGAPASALQEGELFSGGCVVDVDHVEHQAVVASNAMGDAGLTLITPTGPVTIATAKLTGSGFIAAQTGGGIEQRFAGTRLQATGTVVFQAVLAREGDSFKLVERSEVEAAAPPSKIVAGKLDRDADTDLMWDITAGLRKRIYQVSLARRVSGASLTAMTSGITQASVATASDFVVADLNGHGVDEMIVFTQGDVTIYAAD